MTLCNWRGGMVRDIWKDHKRGCVRPAEAADQPHVDGGSRGHDRMRTCRVSR